MQSKRNSHPVYPTLRHEFLDAVLSSPTAPFRERRVISQITNKLDEQSVPYFTDPIGNLVIGASSSSEYLKILKKPSTEPLRVFIAHLDHPGFHGTRWTPSGDLEIQWHGGSPTQNLEGAKVWLAHHSNQTNQNYSGQNHWNGFGSMKNAKLLPSGKAIQTATIVLTSESRDQKLQNQVKAQKIYGGFSFRSPVWRDGELIYTQAADDLVGSFSIVSVALDLWKKGKKKNRAGSAPPFLGLLTRAEEVGFIGAIGHFELGWLQKAKKPPICVSLETSRTLPGAEIGKGPVIRLGDKYTVFDASALRVFSDLAHSVLPECHQRRVMDGGTCEGTAATAYGFPCIGISVPLGNYHNQSLEGGPDAGPAQAPAPEFVHSQDVAGQIALCHGLLQPKLPWSTPWKRKIQEFKKDLKDYQPLLRSGP